MSAFGIPESGCLLPDAGAKVEVHEFDCKQTGVVYDRNGVVIKSFPAVHIYDGPVSYRLEWNGLTFVFSGDTTPSQFFVDSAKGAELLIHECFNTVTQLIERSGYNEKTACAIGTMIHTSPNKAGQVLALVKPRCDSNPRSSWPRHPAGAIGPASRALLAVRSPDAATVQRVGSSARREVVRFRR